MSSASIVIEDQVRIPRDVFDLEGFRRWASSSDFPERGRFSFIAGQVEVDMSPEELQTHAKLKLDLSAGLWNWVRQRNIGELLPDGALVVSPEAEFATKPDLTFCRWESLRSGRVRYEERIAGSGRQIEVVGSPDLVVEIVSQHSVRKDTLLLRERYFIAGIEEYWLIDARGEDIDFQLLVRGEDGFVAAPPDADGYCRSKVFDARFRLTRDLNPVGGYRYTLLIAPTENDLGSREK